MIRYNPKDWFGLVFHWYSRYVIKTLMPILIFMGLYTLLVCFLIIDYFQLDYKSTVTIHSLLGIVLGLFLVFRTNTAYDRWWEGRKQWGSLVNSSRNMAQKINAFFDKDDLENREFFARMIPNFVYALKEHLRGRVLPEELDATDSSFGKSLGESSHKPNKIASLIYERINKAYKDGVLTGDQLFIMDKELKDLTDILGACERIRNTPIPYSYSMFMKKFIFTFTITLPFGVVTDFHYWTIPIVLMIFYILVSIELIAEEIEDPFGRDINDLPTDDLAFKVKNNIKEIILPRVKSEKEDLVII
jgi:putative membrane protein